MTIRIFEKPNKLSLSFKLIFVFFSKQNMHFHCDFLIISKPIITLPSFSQKLIIFFSFLFLSFYHFRKYFCKIARKSSLLDGLSMNPFIPDSSQAALMSESANAVQAIIGVEFFSIYLIYLAHSIPFITGIFTSMIISPILFPCFLRISIACCPLYASRMCSLSPMLEKINFSAKTLKISSSTTNIFFYSCLSLL